MAVEADGGGFSNEDGLNLYTFEGRKKIIEHLKRKPIGDIENFYLVKKDGFEYVYEDEDEDEEKKELGHGTDATVFCCRLKSTKELMALKPFKVYHNDFSEDFYEQLKDEFRIKKLVNCENVITLHGVCQTKTKNYVRFILLLPMCEWTLEQYVTMNCLSSQINIELAYQIALGMEYLHSNGIVHMDLKGSNVLVKDGIAKIIDFGEVRKRSEPKISSASYMPPEAFGKQLNVWRAQQDIYSFGILLFLIITGTVPHASYGDVITEVVNNHTTPKIPEKYSSQKNANIFLAELMEKCLHYEPENRLQSWATILEKLKPKACPEEERSTIAKNQELGDWKKQADEIAKQTRDQQIAHQKLQRKARLAQQRANEQLEQSLEKIATTQIKALKRMERKVAKLILQDGAHDTCDNADKIVGLEKMLQKKLARIEKKVTDLSNEHKKEMEKIDKTFQELEQNMESQDHLRDQTQDLFNKLLEKLRSDEVWDSTRPTSVDARDRAGRWRLGEIVDKNIIDKKVQVKFRVRSEEWHEWIPWNSERIAPLGSKRVAQNRLKIKRPARSPSALKRKSGQFRKPVHARNLSKNPPPKKGTLNLVELQTQYKKNNATFSHSIPSIFLFACESGQLDVLEWLLSITADVNECYPPTGDSGLMISTLYGHNNIVELLVTKGADVNHENSSGETALTVAVKCGYTSIVEFLVLKGADINHTDKMGLTPHKLAEANGFHKIKDFLTEKSNEEASREPPRPPPFLQPVDVSDDPDDNIQTPNPPKSAPASIRRRSLIAVELSDAECGDELKGKEEYQNEDRAVSFTVPKTERIFRFEQTSSREALGLGLGKTGFVKDVDTNSLAERHGIQRGWLLTGVNGEKAKYGYAALKKQIRQARKADNVFILKFKEPTPDAGGSRSRSKSEMVTRGKTSSRSKTWSRLKRSSISRSKSNRSVFEEPKNPKAAPAADHLQSPALRIGRPKKQSRSTRRALSPSRALAISLYQDDIEDTDFEEEKNRTAREFQQNIVTLKAGIHLMRVLKNGQTKKCKFELLEHTSIEREMAEVYLNKKIFAEYSFACRDKKEILQCSVKLDECILICGQHAFGKVDKLKKHDSRSFTLTSAVQSINLYADTQDLYDRVVSTLKGLKESKTRRTHTSNPSTV